MPALHAATFNPLARLLAPALIAACLTPAASAYILVDDFKHTSDPGLYPRTVVAAFPTPSVATIADPYGSIAGVPALRFTALLPVLSIEQINSGNYAGQQTVDLVTNPGMYTSTSTGDGVPTLITAWISPVIDQQLNIDISAEQALYFNYSSNKEVDVQLSLINAEDDNGNQFTAGNDAFITLPAGQGAFVVPLTDFTGIINVFSPSAPFPGFIDLPNLDPTSLDGISLTISTNTVENVPEGLIFTLREVAFIDSLPIPGDLNNDGFVGIEDLGIVLGNWNQSVSPGDLFFGDPSGDGYVGIDDLNEVLGHWNAGFPPTDNNTVPEPATALLLAAATFSTLTRRQ